jgi:hypothetical protein
MAAQATNNQWMDEWTTLKKKMDTSFKFKGFLGEKDEGKSL